MDLEVLPALLGAFALLLVPGAVLAHVLGFRGLWWFATGPVLSIAAIGVTGVIAAPLRLPFAWWQPSVLVGAAVIVVLGVRALRRRRLLPPRTGRWNRGEALVVAVVVVAGIAAGIIAAVGIGGWEHISQTYDGLFHLNAVAWIQSTGDASSFDLYRITHPGTDNEFYPAAWHALVASTVQLTGASIPMSTNTVWLAMQSLLWMPGIALLGATVAPARRRVLAGAVTAIGAVGLLGFPALLLAWGTLYPTALAYALLPVGLALTVRIMRWVVAAPIDRRLPFPTLLVVVFALWLIASSFAHPRSLFGWVIIAAPLIILEGIVAIRRIWRRPRWRRRLLAVLISVAGAIVLIAAVGSVYVYRTFDLAHRPISDHLNGGPATATQGVLASLAQALDLGPPSPSGPDILPASWMLAALVVIGALIAAVRFRARWVAIAWVLVIVFWVLAAGSNSDLAKVLTGVWYKDKFRLFALLPVVEAPLLSLAVVQVSLLGRGRARAIATSAAVVIVVAAVASSNAVTAGPAMIGRVFALPAHDKRGLLLDRDEERLLQRLPHLVPAGEIVAGDPWDGSSLAWAIGDRRTLFPHLAGEWTPDELLISSSLDQVRTNPAVCAAVHRTGVRWVVEDPQLLWGSPPDAAPFAGFHRAVEAGVLEPVARVGSAGLYRIPSCTT